MGLLIAWVFLFSGSSIRAVLHAQTQVPAYNKLELYSLSKGSGKGINHRVCTHTFLLPPCNSLRALPLD